ncbi:hypothetical protein Tco_0193325, partial [Tanacetum coccineum]
SSAGDFLGTTSFYTMIRDLILRLCHRLIACSIAGRSQAPEKLRLFAAGGKSGAHIYGGQFVTRLAEHFGLLTAEILGGLTLDAATGAPTVAEDAPAADEGDQAVLPPVQAPQQPPPPLQLLLGLCLRD